MLRRPRVFVEGGIYHVYNRFARGADLFADPEEAIEFLEILRKARDRDGLTVFAWAMMSNHYHLAVRAGPVPLSRTMGYVQARFGQRYMIAALGIERWMMTAKALAQSVGRMPEAVSRWGSRGAEMRQESPEFREAYEKLDETLASYDREEKGHPNRNR
jgi:REP element-mobilizing transposase RayT